MKQSCCSYLLWFGTVLALLFKSALVVGVLNYTEFQKAYFADFCAVVPTYAVYLSFIILVLAPSFLLKGRSRVGFLIGINLVLSLVFLFDLWHYRAFGTFLSIHALGQTANLKNLGSSIWSMSQSEDSKLFWDIPVLLLAAGYVYQRCRQIGRNILLYLLLTAGTALYLGYSHYVFDISEERGQKQWLFSLCWAPSQTITGLSPLGYHLFDGYNFISECWPLELTLTEKEAITSWYRDKNEALPSNEYKGMFKGKNIIFIQVESLETFYLKNSLNGQEITPVINRLLKNSLYFSNFYEQVSNGTTADAEFMTNTSVYPLRRGTEYFRYPNNTYNSLPKLLTRQGYSTLAVHPDNKAYWNWQYNMESIGYELCLDSTNFVLDEHIGLGLSDGSFFRQTAPIIAERKPPFLIFMITLTNHTTYELPDKYKELEVDSKFAGTMLGKSFHTVHYTDKQLGIFINQLEMAGLMEDTVVVIYGDHNGVHKMYSQEVQGIAPVENWWLDNEHRVPFIIYHKGLTGREIPTIGGHVDILPTVAYLMGVEEQDYINTAMGRNLLNTAKNFAVMPDGQFIGEAASERDKEQAVYGWELADIIIRSSYFGKR